MDPSCETFVLHVPATVTQNNGRSGDPTSDTYIAFEAFQKPTAGRISPTLGHRAAVAVLDRSQITHPENRARVMPGDPAPTLNKRAERMAAVYANAVRRLTPLECERLQGLPDNYTNIPGASDFARYAAVGNGMAVPVMEWLGRRIDAVEELL